MTEVATVDTDHGRAVAPDPGGAGTPLDLDVDVLADVVGRVLRLALPAGDVVGEFDVGLPAGVKLGPDRAWVTSYLDNELVGFPR